MRCVCVCVRVLKAPLCVPWAVLTLPPCVVVVCVLNTCSPYPCHSGHWIALHRRLPGLAQLAAQEHQEHELRQPRLPQNHGGRRRRNPHRKTQRVHRSRLPSSEWQPQSAIHSASSRWRHHRQQFSLVLRGADALQWQMSEAAGERKEYLVLESMRRGFGKPVCFTRRPGRKEQARTRTHSHTSFLQSSLKTPVVHTHKPFTSTSRSHFLPPS